MPVPQGVELVLDIIWTIEAFQEVWVTEQQESNSVSDPGSFVRGLYCSQGTVKRLPPYCHVLPPTRTNAALMMQ